MLKYYIFISDKIDFFPCRFCKFNGSCDFRYRMIVTAHGIQNNRHV